MTRLKFAIARVALAAFALSTGAARAGPLQNPLQFFEGRTESVSTVKVVMKKPLQSRSIGRGNILPDGSLNLVQRVEEEGRAPFERRWKIRQIGPGRYAGTMSEAKGPVTIDEVGDRYRFRFKMKGNLAVEQWLSPLPGNKAASTKVTIRKFGMAVAKSEGTIRKIG